MAAEKVDSCVTLPHFFLNLKFNELVQQNMAHNSYYTLQAVFTQYIKILYKNMF